MAYLALIKGNKKSKSKADRPKARHSALIKTTVSERPLNPLQPDASLPQAETDPAASTETFKPKAPTTDSSNPPLKQSTKILGIPNKDKERSSARTILPPIRETIIIGGDPEPEPEPAPERTVPPDSTSQQQQKDIPPPPPPVDEQILEEAKRKAEQILSQAQEQAQHMLSQMARQAQEAAQQAQEQAHRLGYEAGYQEGLTKGIQEGKAQFTELFSQARELYVQAVKERKRLLAHAEPELARLALKIAQKIVGEELKCNQDLIVGVVKEALSGIKDREEVVIRVNPADLEQARQQRTYFEKMIEGLKKFNIVSDPTIDRGGCAIETNLGNIDARLSTRIQAVIQGLEETISNREKEIAEELESASCEITDSLPLSEVPVQANESTADNQLEDSLPPPEKDMSSQATAAQETEKGEIHARPEG